MDTAALRTEAIEYARKAVEFEDKEKYEEALRSYKKAITNLEVISQNDENKYNRETYQTKIKEYNERVDYLDKLLNSKKNKKEAVGGK